VLFQSTHCAETRINTLTHTCTHTRTRAQGWGCAYRSLQTIASWYRLNGYTVVPVPDHGAIQRALVAVGDKPPSFVGSRTWIGSQEIGYALEHLMGVRARAARSDTAAAAAVADLMRRVSGCVGCALCV
jgi:hypothetical protein